MRIGLDCRAMQGEGVAGIGYYIRNLFSGMLDRYTDDEFVFFFEHILSSLKDVKIIEALSRGQVIEKTEGAEYLRPNSTIRYLKLSEYKQFLPVFYSHILVGGFLRQENLDIFHGPANVVPLAFRGRIVVTVHDLAIYRHPEWFPKQYFSTRVVVPQSLKVADKIIAVSQSTKSDIVDIFKISDSKIEVIPNGVDLAKFHPADDKEDVFREMVQKHKIDKP